MFMSLLEWVCLNSLPSLLKVWLQFFSNVGISIYMNGEMMNGWNQSFLFISELFTVWTILATQVMNKRPHQQSSSLWIEDPVCFCVPFSCCEKMKRRKLGTKDEQDNAWKSQRPFFIMLACRILPCFHAHVIIPHNSYTCCLMFHFSNVTHKDQYTRNLNGGGCLEGVKTLQHNRRF